MNADDPSAFPSWPAPDFGSSDSGPSSRPEWPQDAAPAPPPEPAWRGVDVAVFLLFSGFVMTVVLLGSVMIAGLTSRAGGFTAPAQSLMTVLLLAAQAAGLIAGAILAAYWIPNHSGQRFLEAIHWRRLPARQVYSIAVTGALVALVFQFLMQRLPNPGPLPEDKLFSPATIWPITVYGVIFAPLLEEFYFRGLIFPSLRASFRDGLTREDRAAWQPAVRLVAAIAALVSGYLWLRLRMLNGLEGISLPHTGLVWLQALFAACLFFAVLPQPLLALAAAILRGLGRLHRPQLLAILATGILFGLVHGAQLAGAWAPLLFLSVVGILLTALRASTDSLVSSWVFHCAYNGALFVLMFITTKGYHDFRPLLH